MEDVRLSIARSGYVFGVRVDLNVKGLIDFNFNINPADVFSLLFCRNKAETLLFSWDGQKHTTIKNSSGDDLQTQREHYAGGLGQYDNRPIAIAGHLGKETEIYDWNTQEWETQAEWRINFYSGSSRFMEFAMISFKKYIVVFGGVRSNTQVNKIGTIE